MSSLWGDTQIWEIVKEYAKAITLGQMNSLVDCLLWAEGKSSWVESQKASEIRLYYLKDNYVKMQQRLKSASAETIRRKYLTFLGRFIDLNKFFNTFEISDYQRIINLSTLNSIRKLFNEIQERHWNLTAVAKKLAEALPDADLAHLISQEHSLYRLSGLIGNIVQVDLSAAERFVQKLSELDLSELFSREDPIAKEKGITKARVINYFLTKRISFTPVYRKRIVDMISNDIWQRLIQSASFDESFWLLWNIFINNSEKAKAIVQNNVGNFLIQKCVDKQQVMFYLPLLGVLHVCNFTIKDVPLIETNIIKIKQTLLSFKENIPYPNSTFIVLSLVALKIKLPSQQLENLEGILDMQLKNFILNAPDIRTGEVLSNLIKCYCD